MYSTPSLSRRHFTVQCLLLLASAPGALAADKIDVTHLVFPVPQVSKNACWAAATAMLISWKESKSISKEAAAARGGAKFTEILKKDDGIEAADESEFYKILKLRTIKQQNPSIQAWADLLKAGPLSVTVIANPNVHALIIFGMKGDGSADKTIVSYIDPDGGKTKNLPFSEFLKLYEGAAKWPLQIIHW